MSSDNWNGLDHDGIEKVMTDILDYTDKANKILNNISTIVADTKKYFDCESGDKFRAQYELIKSGIPTFNKNFLSYNADFGRVIKNYRLRQETGVRILNEGKNSVVVSLRKREEI